MYGFEINRDKIENIVLTDRLPTINLRTNGFSFGPVKKGFSTLINSGRADYWSIPISHPISYFRKRVERKSL